LSVKRIAIELDIINMRCIISIMVRRKDPLLEQRAMGVVPRLGRYFRAAAERFGAKRRVNLRPQQTGGKVDARTADSVSVELEIAVRYCVPVHYAVLPENAGDAFRELNAAGDRTSGSISEAVHACVAKMRFTDLQERSDEIAHAVQRELAPLMDRFGYELLDAFVVGIRLSDPLWSPEVDSDDAPPRRTSRATDSSR
jgi:regulator of protease activity HflC (stomatin/prohibitin superfamily)